MQAVHCCNVGEPFWDGQGVPAVFDVRVDVLLIGDGSSRGKGSGDIG